MSGISYVTPTGAGLKNGTSWADAYSDIQSAIDYVANVLHGGEVWIAAGVYKRGAALVMKNNVEIYGGFAGTESDKSQRVPDNITYLDGEKLYGVIYNYYTQSNPLTNSAKLDNVVIQNGKSSIGWGSGLYNRYASPVITNCKFMYNNSIAGAGALHSCMYSSPELTNCTFIGNSALSSGGALFVSEYASNKLVNCTFENNYAANQGGGIGIHTANLTATNCTFIGNSALNGGGISNRYALLPFILSRCEFKNNYAANNGGGIYNYDTQYEIMYCEFTSNYATNNGSGVYDEKSNNSIMNGCDFISQNVGNAGAGVYSLSSSNLSVTNCRFNKNITNKFAGAIWNDHSSPFIQTCTFSGNSALIHTGAIYNDYSDPTIINCNFYENSASGVCGSIYNNYSNPEIKSCNFYENSAINGSCVYNNSVLSSNQIINCTFEKNLNSSIYNISSNPSILGGYFTQNAATSGACIYNYNHSSPRINDCYFINNSSTFGAALFNLSSSAPSLLYCTFSNNIASYGASLYNIYDSSPTLTSCTIYSNLASTCGAGLYNSNISNPSLVNCTLFSNSGSNGAGIYNILSSNPSLLYCTFSGNSAYANNSHGGGMYSCQSSKPSAINCIFWGDTAKGEGKELYNTSNSNTFIDTCIVSGGYSTGTNVITADPKLRILSSYEGFVLTMPVSAGSSAINTGKFNDVVLVDARGISRYIYEPTIGACEYSLVDISRDKFSIETVENYYKFVSNYEFTLQPNLPKIANSISYTWCKNNIPVGNNIDIPTYTTNQTTRFADYTLNISDGTLSVLSNPLRIETIDTARYYVSTQGLSSNTGLKWNESKNKVQDGINEASEVYGGCEVWVASGTYKQGSALKMKKGVSLYGGFAGFEKNKDQRIYGENITYLDGNNSYRVFDNGYNTNTAITSDMIIDNVTIQNGYSVSNGAGMYNNYVSPIITNCTFKDNVSRSRGGAVHTSNTPDHLIISDCTFINNTSYYEGGALNTDKLTGAEIKNCTFIGNVANQGGALCNNHDKDLNIINSTFISNYTSCIQTNFDMKGGAGIYNYISSPSIKNCTFTNNSACASISSIGGAIFTDSGAPTATNCIMWGDVSNDGNNEINSRPGQVINTCIIEGGYNTGTNIISSNPLLGTLGNYGGSVLTIPVLLNSPAISTAVVLSDVKTDARNVIRSNTPTIGAFEYNSKLPYYHSTTKGKVLFNETPLNISEKPTVISFEYNMPYSDENKNEQFCFFVSIDTLDTLSSDAFTAIPLNNNYSGMYDPYLSAMPYPTIYDIALTESNYFAISGDSQHGDGISITNNNLNTPSVVIRGYNTVTNIPHYMYKYNLLDYNPLDSDPNIFNQLRIRFSEMGTKINVDLKLHSSELSSDKISDKSFVNIMECKVPFDTSNILSNNLVMFGLSYNTSPQNPIKIRNITINQ